MRRTKIGTGLAALALAAAGVLVSAAPAQAAGGQNCYHFDRIICAPLEVNWPWPPDWHMYTEVVANPVIDPDLAHRGAGHFAQGMSNLGQAAFTTDPARKAALRNAALNEFTSAARLTNGSRLSIGRTGWIDPAGALDPQPVPWLQASGVDVADGVALLHRSFADPVGAPRWRALAVAQFDEAYTELANQRVIEG